MEVFDLCKEYCIGCGLCQSELHTNMENDVRGFAHPVFKKNEESERFLREVCPISDSFADNDVGELWGKAKAVYAGYSTDEDIRKKASSGGFLTEMAIFLLESGKVDGILQVAADEKNPIATVAQVSRTKEQVIKCCGSRYSISSPWCKLSSCIREGEKYAAIGKPCDIRALKRLKKFNSQYEGICYLLSFFCAGLPSRKANEELLRKLGCEEKACSSLTYRGNGWPGYATAVDDKGIEHKMEYSQAWGKILGRDINMYCRLCLDGIGESADIACGDGWYIAENGEPDFSEREGRNVVFARTEKGDRLIKEAAEACRVEVLPWDNVETLKKIQKYQYTRKTTMRAKIKAYALMGRKTPRFHKPILKKYAQMTSVKEKFRVFGGTVKRILNKKI